MSAWHRAAVATATSDRAPAPLDEPDGESLSLRQVTETDGIVST